MDQNTTPEAEPGAITEKPGRATYCPEDNKLRLYVGRVPRDEYLKLKAEGWQALHKQRETGGGDFAAVWTPARRDTALGYADMIEDEDAGPAERAADRAERFSGYRDKRSDEATGRADRYESGPSAHGYQSAARAERAAARHDRIAGHAVDAWSKAEYWQRRTAGVISHALYKSAPGVRMGRIKEIEAHIRKIEANYKEANIVHSSKHEVLLAVVEHAEGKREKLLPWPGWQYSVSYVREADKLTEDAELTPEQLRRCMVSAVFSGEYSGKWSELRKRAQVGEIEAAAVAREWLNVHGWNTPEPYDFTKSDWHQHLTLRLAYENQMIEAVGGRAADLEIIPGGFIGGKQVLRVTKSPATGRVVSVVVKMAHRWKHDGVEVPQLLNIERAGADSYRPPTEQELVEFKSRMAALKAARPKVIKPPLVNPTDQEAERLQAVLNERAKADHCARHLKAYGKDYAAEFKLSTVCRITQAHYSAASGGSYARAETRGLCANMELEPRSSNMYTSRAKEEQERRGPKVCEIRTTGSDGSDYGARRVIVLTDKPQKPLPAAVWEPYVAPVTAPALVTA